MSQDNQRSGNQPSPPATQTSSPPAAAPSPPPPPPPPPPSSLTLEHYTKGDWAVKVDKK